MRKIERNNSYPGVELKSIFKRTDSNAGTPLKDTHGRPSNSPVPSDLKNLKSQSDLDVQMLRGSQSSKTESK